MRGERNLGWKEENIRFNGTRYERKNKRDPDGDSQFAFFMLRNPALL